jgi:Tfp pilus assembly protein PilV
MRNELGQSLVEALVALGIAVIIVSAVAIAVISAVNNSDFSKNQNLATQFAQQAMELLKQKSSDNWQSFSVFSGTYCLNQDSTTLIAAAPTCAKNINNFFVRQVTINQNDPSCSNNAKVVVSVLWSDGKCTSSSNVFCHSVVLDSCLANINSSLAP